MILATSLSGPRAFRPFRSRVVLALALLLASLASCGRLSSLTEAEHIAQVQKYLAKRDVSAAIVELKNAVQQHPESGELRRLLGEAYLQTGQGKDAETQLRRAQELGIPPAKVQVALGRSLLMQSDYRGVLTAIAPDDRMSPAEAAQVLALHGEAQSALGVRDQAAASYRRALERDPAVALASVGLARLSLIAGDVAGARQLAAAAQDQSPTDALAWIQKGHLHRLLQDKDAAMADFGRALELEPVNTSPRVSLTLLEIASGRLEQAERNVAFMQQRAPKLPMVHYLRALLEFRRGKHAAARDDIQKVLAAAPDHIPSLLLSGAVLHQSGAYEQAERNLRSVLARDPASTPARKMLAATLIRSNRPGQAIDLLGSLPGDAVRDPDVLRLLADAYQQAGQHAKAGEYLAKLAALKPEDAQLRAQVGLARADAGQLDAAIGDLEMAATLAGPGSQPETMLVQTLLGARKHDQALVAARKLTEREPANPTAFNMRGAAELAKGDRAAARKSFEQALAAKPDYMPALMNLGQLDLDAKDYAAARKRYGQVLAADARHLDALLAMARVASLAGEAREVANWLAKAKQENPSAVVPRLLIAERYLRARDLTKALAELKDAEKAAPQSSDVLNLLGETQVAAGERASAVATFHKLVALNANSAAAYWKLAGAQSAAGEGEAAAQSLARALQIEPAHAGAATMLVSMEVGRGRLERALKLAKDLEKQQPKSPLGYALEGDVLAQQRSFAQAGAAYDKAFALRPSGALAVKRHAAYSQAGKAKDADAGLQKWLAEHPADVDARLYMANVSVVAGRAAAAGEQYQLVLHKDPANVAALVGLAALYHQQKDPRALDYAERAYRAKPNLLTAADTLGQILMSRGNAARGVEVFRHAVSLAPEDRPVRLRLAAALAAAGDKAAARREVDALLASGKDFPERAAAEALRRTL